MIGGLAASLWVGEVSGRQDVSGHRHKKDTWMCLGVAAASVRALPQFLAGMAGLSSQSQHSQTSVDSESTAKPAMPAKNSASSTSLAPPHANWLADPSVASMPCKLALHGNMQDFPLLLLVLHVAAVLLMLHDPPAQFLLLLHVAAVLPMVQAWPTLGPLCPVFTWMKTCLTGCGWTASSLW